VAYLSASAVVIHYEEALYQVYVPLHLPFSPTVPKPAGHLVFAGDGPPCPLLPPLATALETELTTGHIFMAHDPRDPSAN